MKWRDAAGCLVALMGAGCADLEGQQDDVEADIGSNHASADFGPVAAADAPGTLRLQVTADGLVTPLIGNGYNTITQDLRSRCVQSAPLKGTSGEASIVFDRSLTQAETNQSLGISSSAKASYGLFSGSARASFTRATQSSSRSISMMYRNYTTVNSELLNESALTWNVAKTDRAWFTKCGDGFVQEVKLGGELYILVRLDFATESEKTAFEASVGGSYGSLASGSVTLSKAAQSFKGRATIHLEAYQHGGATENLGHVFGSASPEGPRATVDCSFDNLGACNAFMTNALGYATGAGASDFPKNLKANPAALSYIVRDWPLLGAGIATQNVPDRVAGARSALLVMYMQQIEVLNRFDALQRAGFYGAPSSFRDAAAGYARVAAANINLIQSSVARCFDQLSIPPTEAQASSCVSYAAPGKLAQLGYTDLGGALAAMDVKLPTTSQLGRADFAQFVTPGSGFWGTWTDYAMCPANTYAIGYRMRTEAALGRDADDTGLNAIELTCAPWSRSTMTAIVPHPGHWGDWYPKQFCNRGPINGMRLDVEPPQGNRDDTAADNVVASCVSGEIFNAPNHAEVQGWGTIQTWAYCPPGSAVCGASVRMEPDLGRNGDDTAMNGLTLACCAY